MKKTITTKTSYQSATKVYETGHYDEPDFKKELLQEKLKKYQYDNVFQKIFDRLFDIF